MNVLPPAAFGRRRAPPFDEILPGTAISMRSRLTQALVAYAVLAIAAYFLVSGSVLLVILVVLAAFAAKTLLWHFKPED
jgi:hypothetical protein